MTKYQDETLGDEMLSTTKTILILFVCLSGLISVSCSTAPKLEKVSAEYTTCDAKKLKPMEVTNYGWYQSWYVDCNGKEYFCRYSPTNQNGWNGCRVNWITQAAHGN